MKVECLNHRNEVSKRKLLNKNIVVIDVLRATSVMVTALDHGAKAIIPFQTLEETHQFGKNRPDVLKCGERNAQKIEGFHHGNSPLEMMGDSIVGKTLLMTTTNGTATIKACDIGERILIATYINALAVAKELAKEEKDIVIVCSGTDLQTSADDVLTAGRLIDYITQLTNDFELTDMAALAKEFYESAKSDIHGYLKKNCYHYRRLESLGCSKDLAYCFSDQVIETVPFYQKGIIEVD